VSGIYYYRPKSQHKYQQLDKTLWFYLIVVIYVVFLNGNNKYHYVL